MGSTRKGIILAGGTGTRLYPMSSVVNKQLLPVYDKPMIYYSLSVLMNSGISDILLISTVDQIAHYKGLFGNGDRVGLNLSYAVQNKPRGIADAFLIGSDVKFLKKDPVALVLGDNIFYGEEFYIDVSYISKMNANYIFGYRVSNPQDYGVVEFDRIGDNYTGQVIVKSLEEKPISPKSRYAVPGLYFYDNTVVDRVKTLKPSRRGELEITDLNNLYIKDNKLNVKILNDNAAWFDTGTPASMFEATMFVKSIQSRTGNMIGCIDEIAYKKNLITLDKFKDNVTEMPRCDYRSYLINKYNITAVGEVCY